MFYLRIKELREEKRITQIELAKRLNISKSTVAMWESNKDRYPTIETLFKLSNMFNVSIDYLLGAEKQKAIPQDLQQLITYYNQCDVIDQARILAYAEAIAQKEVYNNVSLEKVKKY